MVVGIVVVGEGATDTLAPIEERSLDGAAGRVLNELRRPNVVADRRVVVSKLSLGMVGGVALVNVGVEGTTRGARSTLLHSHVVYVSTRHALASWGEVRSALRTENRSLLHFLIDLGVKFSCVDVTEHPVSSRVLQVVDVGRLIGTHSRS